MNDLAFLKESFNTKTLDIEIEINDCSHQANNILRGKKLN